MVTLRALRTTPTDTPKSLRTTPSKRTHRQPTDRATTRSTQPSPFTSRTCTSNTQAPPPTPQTPRASRCPPKTPRKSPETPLVSPWRNNSPTLMTLTLGYFLIEFWGNAKLQQCHSSFHRSSSASLWRAWLRLGIGGGTGKWLIFLLMLAVGLDSKQLKLGSGSRPISLSLPSRKVSRTGLTSLSLRNSWRRN